MARTTIDSIAAAGNVQFRRGAAYAEPGGRGRTERVPRSGWRYRHQYVPNHQFRGEGAEREKRCPLWATWLPPWPAGALKGARGNSGVILVSDSARLCQCPGRRRGNRLRTVHTDACAPGADTAYKAVMKPKEGTILTVARVMAEDVERNGRQIIRTIDGTVCRGVLAKRRRHPQAARRTCCPC